MITMNQEELKLKAAREEIAAWKKWGPYLSERQWGTVREDYSENGDAWNFFTHDQARSRACRWGEDGIAGGLSSSTVEGSWGYYALFDQVIFQPYGKGDPHAMGMFGSVIVASDPSMSQMPFACTGGALVRGLNPWRPTDSADFGLVYGRFSSDLQTAQQIAQVLDPTVAAQEYELALEWAYRIRMRNGAAYLQPDLQCIINPGGAHQYANALVVGAQAGVNF
jgi:carbohydrate-selective porin OprB